VIAATAAAILGARALEFGGGRIAGLDWLRTAGILSFLIYLVHVPVMQVVSEWTPALPLNATDDLYLFVFTLSVALSAIVSIALHRLIEHPALALSRIPLARKFLLPLALLFMVGFAFAFTMALIGL
jgi:peptidoglycan/LPS O-acetylase OafA/YrhL